MTVHGKDTETSGELRELVNMLPQCRLCVHRNGQTARVRRYVIVTGLGPEHNLGVYNNNVSTIERALVERYFLCKDQDYYRPALLVMPHTFRALLFRHFKLDVMEHMPKLPRLSRQQVVDRYSGGKRKMYQEALFSLQQEGLTRKDANLLMFVKFEKQDMTKAPRAINPRNRRYNLCLGQYLKHAEKPFYRAINKVFGSRTPMTVIKGVNADVAAAVLRAKWDHFKDPVAVGLDATKFDMHVSLEALQYEHTFYKALFPDSKELRKLLSWQYHNTGKAYAEDGKVEFRMRGKRCSGDLNTSLGNCILMCSMIYVYSRVRMVDIELANNGDDCVVFMERQDLVRFQRNLDVWFRHCGFAMQCEEPSYEFEQIEFCQTRPVQLPTGWRMVRNHSAVLTKDPMCLIPVTNDNTMRKWLGAVGECGRILASGVPVQEAFYRMMESNGTKSSEGFKAEVFKNTTMQSRLLDLTQNNVISAQSRVSYYYAFGLKPDEQVELERYYSEGYVHTLDANPIAREYVVVESGLINSGLLCPNETVTTN